MKKKIAIIILSYNSDHIIKKTILAAKKISNNIIIVDSFSRDKTLKIAKSFNCKIIKRKFINYAKQRNFIIKKYNNLCNWQLHVDADEILTEELIQNIKSVINSNKKNSVYLIKRKVIFMKKLLNFGGTSNWHLRLFPSGTTSVENLKYDQHFISNKSKKYLSGHILDHVAKDISSWIASHNKWSSSDAQIIKTVSKKTVNPNFFGNSIEKRRFYKKIYNNFPFSLLKPIILFLYKYIFLFGFLDGRIGFYYCFLNSLWFKTLVEIKKIESK